MLVRVATILDFVVGLKIYVAGDGESDSVMKKNFSFFKIEKKKSEKYNWCGGVCESVWQ